MENQFGGEVFVKILSDRDFFNTINGTDLNTKSTSGAAPMIDEILFTISDDCMLRAYQSTAITANAKRRYFKLDVSHKIIIGHN
jgi:hypothetical protein